MEILIIRHAIAEPRSDEGGTQPDDHLRELTPKGRRRMKRAARALHRLVPTVDLLASSRLVRARQTADIVSRAYGGFPITNVPEFEPGASLDGMLSWLRQVETSGTVAVVGHEPSLSGLVSHLVAGPAHSVLVLDKGGACLLEVPAGVPPGEARLFWLATSRQLRALGRKR
jgi:phosphohistidine phosphatase